MYSVCSAQTQVHGASMIVTTTCWANEGEGGTGDTQINLRGQFTVRTQE